MITSDYFYGIDHARQYLNGSVIRVDGDPVYVTGCGFDDDGEKTLTYLLLIYMEEPPFTIRLDSDRINFDPVPLGMFNCRDGRGRSTAAYLSRYPARQWKQGLTAEVMQVISVCPNGYVPALRDIFPKEGLARTIKGMYPDLDEALANIQAAKDTSVALSRNFAVDDTEALLYQGTQKPIGTLNIEDRTAILFRPFHYLKEMLEEELPCKAFVNGTV
jgi:hypothetical protein